MRIAILSSRFPYPLERGDKLRLFHQLKVLSRFHEVFLYTVNDDIPSKEDMDEVSLYCQKIVVFQSTWLQKMTGLIYALINGWPFQSGLNFSPKFEKQLNHDLKQQGIDVVYCQLIRMAPYGQKLFLHKVLDYMDALGMGMEKRADLSSWPLRWLYRLEAGRVKKYEKSLSLHFNALSVITQADALALDLPAAHAPLEIVANGIDTHYFVAEKNYKQSYDVGFVGNLGYLPNIGAVQFLVNEIKPLFFKQLGYNLKILVSGARPASEVIALSRENVEVVSWVDDIRTSYWKMKILVAPIFYGTGQQNKILEAMACGIPVICSPEVAIGVGATHQQELLVAEDAAQFVKAIDLLLSDPIIGQRLVEKARAFVEQQYSWEKNTLKLSNLLNTKDIV
ncbi:MAG: glycosyltransferase [Saprospiraceae bacterium]|nr:glycosyltransferase [Saprospiraceae bacterium]MBP9194089.1 glycosyltransferase [Saprospiraceae bacterium]